MAIKKPIVFKLENGLSCVFEGGRGLYSCAIYVAVNAGPRYETGETAGLAHFLEHMLFEGTEKHPSAFDVANMIEEIGGQSGAWTEKEFVVYWTKVPKHNFSVGLAHLAEILFTSKLDELAIAREKSIVKEELARSLDNPEVAIWDLFLGWVYGRDQALGRSTVGEEKSILQVNRERLKNYLSHFYHPSNMAVSVVGDLDFLTVKKEITELFGKIKKKKNLPLLSSKPLKKKVTTRIFRNRSFQSQLAFTFLADATYGHEDLFPLYLIADLLTGAVSARLFHKMVYELGIAYSFGGDYWPLAEGGFFYFSGGFSKDNLERAVGLICEELTRLCVQKVEDEELLKVKARTLAGWFFEYEAGEARARLYLIQQITEGKVHSLYELGKKTDAVTPEDIIRVSKKYFRRENIRLVIRGGLKSSEAGKFEKVLDKYFGENN